MEILFVCTGNASRSPMAERLFRNMLEEKGCRDVRCSSAGTRAVKGGRAHPLMVTLCKERGVSLEDHRRQPLVEIDPERVDLFVVFEEAHRQAVQEMGVPQEKIYLLGGGIADPYRKENLAFLQCRDRIEDALPALYAFVTQRKEERMP